MKHRKTFTKFVSLLCLLLLSLLLYGCTERPDAPEIPTTAYEEIKSIPNLVCHISASDTDQTRVLTGETVYSLYRAVNTALSLSSFNPNDPPPAPTNESTVHIVFYVEGEGTDTAETDRSGYGYLTAATAFYGSYTVYEGGYTQFSLSPFHSHAYKFMVEDGVYETVFTYLG